MEKNYVISKGNRNIEFLRKTLLENLFPTYTIQLLSIHFSSHLYTGTVVDQLSQCWHQPHLLCLNLSSSLHR